MSEEAPVLFGPDNQPVRSDGSEPLAVIFAELAPDHIKNAGLVHDEARRAAPQPQLVAVVLPPNCIIVEPDSQRAAKGESNLMKLAHRSVTIMKGKGSVRMSVHEQRDFANAVIVLTQALGQERIRQVHLGKELRGIIEAHNAYVEKTETEAKDREASLKKLLREAYDAGRSDQCANQVAPDSEVDADFERLYAAIETAE